MKHGRLESDSYSLSLLKTYSLLLAAEDIVDD